MTHENQTSYEGCPWFGLRDCCGTVFQKTIDRISNFKINLITEAGEMIEYSPWVVSQIEANPRMWSALRLENPDFGFKVEDLTLKSRRLLARHHHSGSITVLKYKDCPFIEQD